MTDEKDISDYVLLIVMIIVMVALFAVIMFVFVVPHLAYQLYDSYVTSANVTRSWKIQKCQTSKVKVCDTYKCVLYVTNLRQMLIVNLLETVVAELVHLLELFLDVLEANNTNFSYFVLWHLSDATI